MLSLTTANQLNAKSRLDFTKTVLSPLLEKEHAHTLSQLLRWDRRLAVACTAGAENAFFPRGTMKNDHLSRQARDKHNKSQQQGCILQGQRRRIFSMRFHIQHGELRPYRARKGVVGIEDFPQSV